MRLRANQASTVTAFTRRTSDRRRSPRLRLLGEIHGQLVGLDVPLIVADISREGFGVESSLEFPEGERQMFELSSILNRSVLVVAARAVRSRAQDGASPDQRFFTGFELTVEQPFATTKAIDEWFRGVNEAVEARRPSREVPRGHERRRAPRLDVVGEIHGHVKGPNLRFLVRDFSFGGLCIETDAPLAIDAHHEIQLALRDHMTVTMDVRVAHVRDVSAEAGSPRFLLGLEFAHKNPESRRSVDVMMDEITASLVFELE